MLTCNKGTYIYLHFQFSEKIHVKFYKMASRQQILSLYKSMMKESQKFASYNYRCYALRRVRDSFKENKTLTDQKTIKKEFEYGLQNLAMLRRQVTIGDMYRTEKLVIENMR